MCKPRNGHAVLIAVVEPGWTRAAGWRYGPVLAQVQGYLALIVSSVPDHYRRLLGNHSWLSGLKFGELFRQRRRWEKGSGQN